MKKLLASIVLALSAFGAQAATNVYSITGPGGLIDPSTLISYLTQYPQYNPANVAITGGTINGATLGAASFPLLAPNGSAAAPAYSFSGEPGNGWFRPSSNSIAFASSGASWFSVTPNTVGGVRITTGLSLNFGDQLYILNDAANTLAQRNGLNAQTFNLYNTFTDASNFERLGIIWTSDTAIITTQAAGTGVLHQLFVQGPGAANFGIGATSQTWNIDVAGMLRTGTDNVYDIGYSGGSRPRTIYAATGFVGSITNDNAPAGAIGEYVSSTVATASSLTLATGVTSTITSLTLTPGDWDCTGSVQYTFGATTSYTNLVGGLSLTTATLGPQGNNFDFESAAVVPTAGADMSWSVPLVRVQVAASTTTPVYLTTSATFTVSSLKAYGVERCRRVR